MEKGKAKLNIDSDGWLKRPLRGFLSVEECCEDGTWSGYACTEDIFPDGDSVEICEVLRLTDDEKRRVKKLRNINNTESEAFLLSLLERAGVV